MNFTPAAIALTTLLLITPTAPAGVNPPTGVVAGQEAPSIEDFGWLGGRWQGQMDVGDGLALAEVHYHPPVAGSIVGSFRLTKDGRVMVVELMSLAEVDGQIEMRLRHFGVDLSPWEADAPVTLQLENVDGDLFTFRNHVSDSPRWSYLRLDGPDRFQARSEIFAADGTVSEIKIDYHRVDR